jgi:MFS family permease
MGLLILTYYLPLWYQATKGVSATKSGLDILPYMMSTVIVAGIAGGVISTTGRYWPFLLVSPMLLSVGAGLLYTVGSSTSNGALIGFQIIYGIGVGGAMQNTVMAIQSEWADDEAKVPQATSLVSFAQLLGGIVGVAIAGTLFSNKLRAGLPTDIPSEARAAVLASVDAIKLLDPTVRIAVVDAYVQALKPVFIIAVPAGALAALAAL